MTPDQAFRSNDAKRLRLEELFKDPVMEEALILLKDGNATIDALVDQSEVVSVRILSQLVGFNSALTLLLSLTTPFLLEPEAPAETWGTDKPEGQINQ